MTSARATRAGGPPTGRWSGSADWTRRPTRTVGGWIRAPSKTPCRRSPHIRAALVRPLPGGAGDDRLAAWFQNDGTPANPEELRAFLRERLPEKWQPVAFVPVESFPVTPEGWLDPARLPVPAATFPAGHDRRPR